MNKLDGWMGILLAAALVVLCVVVRLAVTEGMLPYNFAAVASAALFAGFVLKSRVLALAIPVVAMLVSNALIGGYDWGVMLLVYVALVLPVFLGRWIDRRRSQGAALVAWLGGSALASSIVFFVLTNSAVWAFTPWYETTLSGLVRCFVVALPFFKWTLASNLLFTGALFGGFSAMRALARHARSRPALLATPQVR